MNLFKHIYILFFVFSTLTTFGQKEYVSDKVSTFERANNLYENKKYSQALELYKSLLTDSVHSENLLYNIANVYYKTGSLGKSILFYEKVLKINPGNKNAYHNLSLANSKIEDKLEVLPDLFFVSWWKKIIHYFSINEWSWIAVAFSWFSVIAFAFYLFFKKLFIRKSGFYKTFVFGFISVVSLFIVLILSGKIFHTQEIILINKTSFGKDAPSKKAKNNELFHEGTKLEVMDKVGDFYKTKTSEGVVVWVLTNDFETI